MTILLWLFCASLRLTEIPHAFPSAACLTGADRLRVRNWRVRAISRAADPHDRAAGGGQRDRHPSRRARVRLDELHQQVVVDDRPGGALTLGLDLTAKSPPDGYTLCMAPIGALAITRHLVVPLPYSIERDFAPIALVARGQFMLAVSPTTPFHSVAELIDYAKQNPGKLLNASSSNGSPGHVGGELVKVMTGTGIVHVPSKGGRPAINQP